MSELARWTITSAYTEHDTGDPDCPNYRVGATVKGPEQREPIEVVAVSALFEAIQLARDFNRGAMSWREYDGKLAALETGARALPSSGLTKETE
jgi:hypothetical protein